MKEVNLDRSTDDLSSLKNVDIESKLKTLNFNVDDIEYKVEIKDQMFDHEVLSIFSFVNITARKKLVKGDSEDLSTYATRLAQTKTGKTGTGKQMRVFNKIYNIFIKYIEKFKPKYVGYEAIETNRQKLYNTLMKRGIKESGLKFTQLKIHPFTDDTLDVTEFYFEVIYP
jgi:hypothetical protein